LRTHLQSSRYTIL